MTTNRQIPEFTLEERQKQLQQLQAEVDTIFAEAITNHVKIADFSVEIWVNAMLEKKAYVAIACRMIHHSTTFLGDELLQFMRYLANKTLEKDASIVQWAVDLINQGLIINNTLKEKNQNGKFDVQSL
ncbi:MULTISPECIES: hypothetical protein [unclassified Microcoleus]|uniref:hypothetical protein n=1 Tax=unclassified Microcoleus TaxID=2642155 RepID=UPI002FD588D7